MTPWSRQRWLTVLLVVCLAHLGLIVWFSRGHAPPLPRLQPHLAVRFASPEWGARAMASLEWRDPTVFALVSARGFSGSAWLQLHRLQYTPTNLAQPPECLPLPVEELAADFAEFIKTNTVPDDVAFDEVPPALAEPGLAEPMVVPATRMEVAGPLAARGLLPGDALPSLAEPILTNTIVQVLVNPAGRTLSAVLLGSCGVARADQAAVRHAAAARFEPARTVGHAADGPEGGMTFGTLTFRWAGVRWKAPMTAAR